MDSIGIVKINVQNKFLKLWYKNEKITLHDISLKLSKKGKESKEVLARKLISIPIDTIDE